MEKKYKYLLNKNFKFLPQNQVLSRETLENAIIIWSSWMLQGWSIEKWLKILVKNPKAKIVFTGYQWEWTRGREIIDWKDFVVIDWEAIPVRAKWAYIQGFSSHADTSDLINFLEKFKKNYNKIHLALTHWGDNRYKFRSMIDKIKKIKKTYDINIPDLWDKITITL